MRAPRLGARVNPASRRLAAKTVLTLSALAAFAFSDRANAGGQGPADAEEPRATAPGTPPNPSLDKRPAWAVLRQDEDWSSLRDPVLRTDPLDRFKYVPLTADDSIWLSFAIDSHASFRSFDDPNLGFGPGFDATYNIRLNLHAALSIAERVRLYAATKQGGRYGQRGSVSPTNRDRLDLHQAFAEVSFGDVFGGSPNNAVIRVGRQELNYGDGRLIAARVGPNVRSDFDGVLMRTRFGRVTTDLIAFRGVIDRPGVFDNGPDSAESIWGGYSAFAGGDVNLDALYLAQYRGVSPYAFTSTPLSETRHTLGFRIWVPGANNGWRFGVGANYQFGNARGDDVGKLSIRAWSVATNLEHRLWAAERAPHVGIEAGVTSGDRDPDDQTVNTFRSIEPPGRLTGIADGFGPGNLVGVRPYIELHPTSWLRIRTKATLFWRLRETDGLYSLAPSAISRPARGGRFAGVEPGLEAEWRLNDHWTLLGFASRFFVGHGLGVTSLRADVSYAEVTLSFKL